MPDSIYRLSAAFVLRALGPVVIVLGLVWLLVVLTTSSGVLVGCLGVLTLVVVGLATIGLLRPPTVLTLTQSGYRVAFVRGAGATDVAWREVESAGTVRRGGAACLRFALADGRSTVIPLSLLGTSAADAQREAHARLNTAHGYRRL